MLTNEQFSEIPFSEMERALLPIASCDAISLGKLHDSWTSDQPPDWKSLRAGWGSKDDIEIFNEIDQTTKIRHLKGMTYSLTEAYYASARGPWLCESSNLHRLIDTHLKICGEAFFNGDAVIFYRDAQALLLFDHDGNYTLLKRSDFNRKSAI